MNPREYHLGELAIANDENDPRNVMPTLNVRDRRILDVGCGAGQTLIASNLLAGMLAVGIDIDHSAICLGSQLSEKIQFVTAKGEALPFESDCFDLIICRVALPYMNVNKALSEIRRVLKAGGRIWLVLHPLGITLRELGSTVLRLQIKDAVYRLWVLANGLILHAFGRQYAPFFKPGCYESWQTTRAIKRALKRTGFECIQINRQRHFVAIAFKPRGHV
jgi:ubiquinone/menaquinone biosynthesis C-methylase UbiE